MNKFAFAIEIWHIYDIIDLEFMPTEVFRYMKIMHLADFHLDSAFSGFKKEESDRRRAELRECFLRAMDVAREREVDLVLISGDLFDTPFCSASTRSAVFSAIEKLGRPVVIAPGNHDYYNKNGTYADKALPENAYVFTSDELGRFDFDELGVSVIGYAFTSDRYEENPLGGEVPTSSENINILCAHAELGTHISKYAPISANAIARNGFSYAALGHVHVPAEPTVAGRTLIAYSGFPQGRSFDELGTGGAYIVEIDRESKSARICERVELSTVTYEIEKVDVTACSSDAQVIAKIEAATEGRGYGKDTALRVQLTGAVPSDYAINEEKLSSCELAERFALLQIKNRTVANFDLEHLKTDMTVKGELYRQLLPALESADENERQVASLALKFALAALDKREFGVD